MYLPTKATHKLLKLRKRIKLVPGGTSAGKTISILQILIDKSLTDYQCSIDGLKGCQDRSHRKSWKMQPKLTSITGPTFPHLRKGAMRDFIDIMEQHRYFKPERWSKTDYTYTFETGSQIEFFSTDQSDKVRGPRRDRLYSNEVNLTPRETWEQLLIRTREEAWADWNPTNDFYMYEEYGLNDSGDEITTTDPRVDAIILTYKDNDALEAAIVEEIEMRAARSATWRKVYAEGKRGDLEGKVYSNWLPIEKIPHEARLERRGLDFGYTNDPTAIVDIYSYNGGLILDEQMYQKGMSNKQIADFLKNLPRPNTIIVGDSSEPKSIDEIRSYGVPIIPARKGNDSIRAGIQKLQDQQVSVTTASTFLWKEYYNYMWMTDRDGKPLNEPIDSWNHMMDAIRYGMETLNPTIKHEPVETQPLFDKDGFF